MMFKAEEGDTYVDDKLTYQLAVKMNVLVADENCKDNGLWHWNPLLLHPDPVHPVLPDLRGHLKGPRPSPEVIE